MMSFRFTLIACAAIGIAFACAVRGEDVAAQNSSLANSGEVNESDEIRIIDWTDQQVARWAYDNSPLAKLLEAERVAVAKQVSLKSEEERACVGLIQAVLRELALHQRNESASDALNAYYRGVGTKALFGPLRRIAPVLEDLQHLAETAEDLDIPDGDPALLEDQRLQFEDQWFQLHFGLERIESHLSRITAQVNDPRAEYDLISPMPIDFAVFTDNGVGAELKHDVDLLVVEAFKNRKDLAAIRVLCACMNEKSLPAARRLLGAFIPGGGDLLGGLPGGVLSFLHHHEEDDLAERKAQCRQLFHHRKREIEGEVRDAVLEMQANQARLRIVARRWRNKAQEAERSARSAPYDLQAPGTVQKLQIEVFQLEAEKILQEQELAISVVKLRRAVGCVLNP